MVILDKLIKKQARTSAFVILEDCNMRLFQFIRNYYLYFYFHTTELKRKGKAASDPFQGFISTSFFVMSFHTATVLYTFNAIGVEFITDTFREQIFYFRGNINWMVILTIALSIVPTYITCCYKIQYGEIESRLQETKWLAKRSALKLLLLPIFSFTLFILSGILFY